MSLTLSKPSLWTFKQIMETHNSEFHAAQLLLRGDTTYKADHDQGAAHHHAKIIWMTITILYFMLPATFLTMKLICWLHEMLAPPAEPNGTSEERDRNGQQGSIEIWCSRETLVHIWRKTMTNQLSQCRQDPTM